MKYLRLLLLAMLYSPLVNAAQSPELAASCGQWLDEVQTVLKITVSKDSRRFKVEVRDSDEIPPPLLIEGALWNVGYVSFFVESRDEVGHLIHPKFKARLAFHAMISAFTKNSAVRGILDTWNAHWPTNLDAFNDNLRAGMSPPEAALNTWTGKRATELGFTKVSFVRNDESLVTDISQTEFKPSPLGRYDYMRVLFHE